MRSSRRVLLTTTSTLEGWDISDYIGPVSAQFVIGTGMFADFFSGWTDFFGAHSQSYQKKLDRIHQEALSLITEKALQLRANVVLGLRVDHDEIAGAGKSMLMVTATGTAVVASKRAAMENARPDRPRSISGPDLRALLAVDQVVSLAERGELGWRNDATWQTILDNRVGACAQPFLEHLRRVLTPAYAPEHEREYYSRRFQEFVRALERTDAIDFLYGCLEGPWILYSWATDVARDLRVFDARLLQEALAAAPPLRGRALNWCILDKPFYEPADLADLEVLQLKVKQIQPAVTQEKQGMFGKKVIWACHCGQDNDEGQNACGKCGADQFGSERGLADRDTVLTLLQDKQRVLRRTFRSDGED